MSPSERCSIHAIAFPMLSTIHGTMCNLAMAMAAGMNMQMEAQVSMTSAQTSNPVAHMAPPQMQQAQY